MRLTRALNFYTKYKKVTGRLHAGTHQAVPKIYPAHKARALKWYMMEEDNEKILARPFLTEEEDNGHMEALGFTKEAKEKAEIRQKYIDRWNKPMERRIHYLEESLKHLNVKKRWE